MARIQARLWRFRFVADVEVFFPTLAHRQTKAVLALAAAVVAVCSACNLLLVRGPRLALCKYLLKVALQATAMTARLIVSLKVIPVPQTGGLVMRRSRLNVLVAWVARCALARLATI